MYDVIIIGCGPAGMTAALYLLRSGKKVLILDSLTYGGQMVNTPKIENYPGCRNISGLDLAENMYNQIIDLNAEVVFEAVIKVDGKKVITEENEYSAKAIIIATGVKNRPLGLENEEELIGSGVCYCAICDGPFYKDEEVAVVGGGNTAIEDAIFLSDYCKKITLIHRRDSFRAEDTLIKELKGKKNIDIVYNATVTNLLATEEGLNAIEITSSDDKKWTLNVSAIFIAIGQVPKNEIFKDIINEDNNGYIVSDDTMTNVDGIFVAGDCRTKKVRQITTAVNDGTLAALKVIEYLKNVD